MSPEEDCGFDPTAACVQCGQAVTALSLGGAHICPSCDAGYVKSRNLPKVEVPVLIEGTKALVENESDGLIQCSCGRVYIYSSRFQMNMVEWAGFTVPRCPQCKGVPKSDTRKMSL